MRKEGQRKDRKKDPSRKYLHSIKLRTRCLCLYRVSKVGYYTNIMYDSLLVYFVQRLGISDPIGCAALSLHAEAQKQSSKYFTKPTVTLRRLLLVTLLFYLERAYPASRAKWCRTAEVAHTEDRTHL